LTDSTPSSQGISVLASDSEGQRIASLADQVQDWAVEALAAAGLPATWPECPLHPASHPLLATTSVGRAIWACPRQNQRIADVGSLSAGNDLRH
jgi:hypothetical protein